MDYAKRKYLYISLVALAAMVVAYLTYSLVAYGSPLIKSVNEPHHEELSGHKQ